MTILCCGSWIKFVLESHKSASKSDNINTPRRTPSSSRQRSRSKAVCVWVCVFDRAKAGEYWNSYSYFVKHTKNHLPVIVVYVCVCVLQSVACTPVTRFNLSKVQSSLCRVLELQQVWSCSPFTLYPHRQLTARGRADGHVQDCQTAVWWWDATLFLWGGQHLWEHRERALLLYLPG